MSKHEAVHRASDHTKAEPHQDASANLIGCVLNTYERTTRATGTVAGGLWDGAVYDAQKQFHDPGHLAEETWGAIKSGITGKAIGLGARICPPLAVGAIGYSLYSFGTETAPTLGKKIPELEKLWHKAYEETDENKLAAIKNKVGTEYGHTALQLGVNGTMAIVGFGAGLKTGTFVKGVQHSGEILKETSHTNPFKAVYMDKVLQQKPHGSRVVVDGDRKTVYHADKSYDVHYGDGSTFSKKPGLPGEMRYANGEVTREVPGVMRIKDKPNGDRTYKYHDSGLLETHKPSGTVIKEFSDGVVETHRKNGFIYREHPNGSAEVLKKQFVPRS